nr:hypothetical protein [Oleomonas cavernae]
MASIEAGLLRRRNLPQQGDRPGHDRPKPPGAAGQRLQGDRGRHQGHSRHHPDGQVGEREDDDRAQPAPGRAATPKMGHRPGEQRRHHGQQHQQPSLSRLRRRVEEEQQLQPLPVPGRKIAGGGTAETLPRAPAAGAEQRSPSHQADGQQRQPNVFTHLRHERFPMVYRPAASIVQAGSAVLFPIPRQATCSSTNGAGKSRTAMAAHERRPARPARPGGCGRRPDDAMHHVACAARAWPASMPPLMKGGRPPGAFRSRRPAFSAPTAALVNPQLMLRRGEGDRCLERETGSTDPERLR